MGNFDSNFNKKILDKADVIARTVICQQDFYFSKECNENHKQLWIPEGCAHGFFVKSDSADFLYKTTDSSSKFRSPRATYQLFGSWIHEYLSRSGSTRLVV